MAQLQQEGKSAGSKTVAAASWFGRQFGVTQAAQSVQRDSKTVSGIVRQSLQVIRSGTTGEARRETFEEAVDRLGVDEAGIVEAVKTQRMQAMLYLGLFALNVALLAYWAFTGELLGFIACAAIAAAFGSASLQALFRAWQFSRRNLISFPEWFGRGEFLAGLTDPPSAAR